MKDSALRTKARYYFLEGADAAADDRIGEAYSYFRKAYDTDTTYTEAAYAYGTMRMYMAGRDQTPEADREWTESFNLRRRLIDQYPADYALGRVYAQQLMMTPQRLLNGEPAAREAVRVLERIDSLGSPTPYHLIQLSQAYSALEMPDSVLGSLVRYERREGSTPELLESKVGLLLHSGSADKAAAEIEKYRKEHPRDEYPLLLLARLKYTDQTPDSAFLYLEEAERLNPNSTEVKATIGLMALQQGDTLRFENKVFEALTAPEGEYDYKIELLKQYLDVNRPEPGSPAEDKIREAFTSLHSQFPQDAQLYLLEGSVETSLGHNAKGLELLKRAVSINPEDKLSRAMLVQGYLADKQNDVALEELDRIWNELGPDRQLRSIGVYLAQDKGEYDHALHFLTTSLADISPDISPSDTLSLNTPGLRDMSYEDLMTLGAIFQEMGDVYHKTGDTDKMALSFENALIILPNSPLVLNNYAYYLALDGAFLDRAEEMARRAITLDPENPMYTDTLAWILFRSGKNDEALSVIEETVGLYEKAIQAHPESAEDINKEMAETRNHYGAILMQAGRKDEALRQWELVLESDPDNQEAKEYIRNNR